MFAVDKALHVGQIHHHVDDGELQLGKFRRHLGDAAGLRKADADDGVGTALGKTPRRLLTLRGVGDLEFQVRLAAFLLPGFGALPGRFAKGLVELAAQLEDHRRLGLGRAEGHQAQKNKSPHLRTSP